MPKWAPRLMWWSNVPFTKSGYGIQTDHICGLLADAGIPVAITPNYGWGTVQTLTIGGVKIYPAGPDLRIRDAWNNAQNFGATVFTPLYDIWAIPDYEQIRNEMRGRCLMVPYCPFDAEDMNPVLRRYMQISDYVVSQSDHGVRLCKKYGINEVQRLYHGVDCEVYRDWVGEKDGTHTLTEADLRARVGHSPDAFLIAMIFMNKGTRKMIPEQWEGVRLFSERNPDVKVEVHCHTLASEPSGWDLHALSQKVGVQPLVSYTHDYDVWHGIEPVAMATLLSASSCLLLASGTEGTGLPAIEAMMCGRPAIVSRYAAQTELVEPVAPELVVKPKVLHWQPILERFCIPDPEGIADALEKVLNSDPERYKKRLREHALKNFSWDVIRPQWLKLYNETLPALIDRKCLDLPDNAWGPRDAEVLAL